VKKFAAILLALVVAACASASAPPPAAGARRTIDIAAEQWVRLALEINTHEEGYVDAYFGPEEWKAQAEANPRDIATLKAAANNLIDMLRVVATRDTDRESVRRANYLIASAESARFRLDMIEGTRIPFQDEAERLFALRPPLRPLESFDPVVARIDAIVPGTGPLYQRIDTFRARYVIPTDRLRTVMDAAIAECRRRTMAHYDLPANENFRMEFVDHQSWSAYNWYQGNNQSLIQVNTDLPITIDRALTLACHEGYPGHHVQGIYNEKLYRERNWVEYSVAPLYSPSGPLNEGGGNYGVDLAFPGEERLAFERDILYPLAGLDPSTARAYSDLRRALSDLSGARIAILAGYLDGRYDRARATELSQRYELTSAVRASQSLDFADHYRSYVINYATGEDVIRAYIERVGATPEARWDAYERTLNEPTLPADLLP
jgi:hypothetical protein